MSDAAGRALNACRAAWKSRLAPEWLWPKELANAAVRGFMPARNSQKFCSEYCQRRSEPSRLRTSRWGQTCLGCGKTMSGRARKFCDVECRSTTNAQLG